MWDNLSVVETFYYAMLKWIVLVLALIKALNACSPTNEHEQSIYCNTQYGKYVTHLSITALCSDVLLLTAVDER